MIVTVIMQEMLIKQIEEYEKQMAFYKRKKSWKEADGLEIRRSLTVGAFYIELDRLKRRIAYLEANNIEKAFRHMDKYDNIDKYL